MSKTASKPSYAFQPELQERVINALLQSGKAVLAAAPSAGKTTMSMQVVKALREKLPGLKTLILTHGQVLLREQWCARYMTSDDHKDVTVFRKGRKPKIAAPITIAIPQSLRTFPKGYKADLVIVDEAHQWYHASQVQKVIQQVNPQYQLLLTGSPSKFVDDPQWEVVGITLSELLRYGTSCDPLIELAEFTYDLSFDDMNREDFCVKDNVSFSNKETIRTLDGLLKRIILRLASKHRTDPGQFPKTTKNTTWSELVTKLRKTMIVCHNQAHAKSVKRYFSKCGVGAQLSVSDSDSDSGVAALKNFKEDDACHIFVVVNRGVLGFDFPELFNIIDMSGSLNVDKLFQLLCRAVRVSTTAPKQKKLFLKLTNNRLSAPTYQVMSYVVALSQPQFYYAKTDFRSKKIPVKQQFIAALNNSSSTENRRPNLKDLPELFTFNDLSRVGSSIESVAYTDFATVQSKLGVRTKVVMWEVDAALAEARRYAVLGKKRKDFSAEKRSANNCLVKACPELFDSILPQSRSPVTLERAVATAKMFAAEGKSRKDFERVAGGPCKLLREDYPHLLDEILPRQRASWTVESSEAEARKYAEDGKKLSEFNTERSQCSILLKSAKPELVKELFPPRKRVSRKWPIGVAISKAKEFAAKGKSATQFARMHGQAYNVIRRERYELLAEIFGRSFRGVRERFSFEGEMLTISEIGRRVGVNNKTIRARMGRCECSLEEAIKMRPREALKLPRQKKQEQTRP